MKKATKIWLVIAVSLVLIGCIIFGGVMSMLSWDFTKLSTSKYETNNYEIDENFKNISVVTDTADVVFIVSDDGKCRVECYEQKNVKHSVTVKDDTLVVEVDDARKWYEHIGVNFSKPKITVHLPKTEYNSLLIKESTGNIDIPKDFNFQNADILLSTGDVDFYASVSEVICIKGSTGDIRIENIFAGTLDLSVTTGKVTATGVTCEGDVAVGVSTGKAYLTNITCKSLTSSGDTGDITLKNVIAEEKFSIERSTGDVKFDGCDADELFVETDTGDVTGSLLSDKVFITETDTGKINVPRSTTGGRCEISTDTGNIKIAVKD